VSINNTVREASRSLVEGEREFVLHYRLTVQITDDGRDERHSITALSMENTKASTVNESACSVHIMNLSAETSRKLFELITAAQSPVFPVHLPDILRDQIRGMTFYEVSPTVVEEP
jgi:hypothetical protein